MDERGKLEGLVGIAKDITERKRSEVELRSAYNQLKIYQSHLIEAEKMDTVGRLASGVAHEVKNPLAIILQGIEYLSTMISSDNKDVAFALRSINDAIIRADKVVKGLLDFSTISEISMAQENLNSVIESALVLVKNYTLRHKIELIADLGREVPSVDIDRNRIEQVLVNLFINAIDAMPDGGQLEIMTYAKKLTEPGENIGIRKEDTFKLGETVVIAEVKDSGSGMPEDVLRKIFDPFFTTKRSRGGTGLGLSIVRNIMDMHGGKIKIENRKDVRGVKATLIFKTKSEKG
jgi:signal transduction histidine kinase